jgi:hypothetical protein
MEDSTDMSGIQVHATARQLFQSAGPKAVALAAQKASALEREGKAEQAKEWRRIEAALVLMVGPRAS